ncbi:MAG: efflux RND transporter periplasmic adaptor subunit [Fimbriimonadales bacterium]
MSQRALLSISLLFVTLIGCSKNSEQTKRDDPAAHVESSHDSAHKEIALSEEAIKIAGIVAETIERQGMQAQISVPGVVNSTALGMAHVTPPVDGKVLRILVNVGDKVSLGQAVAVIESPELSNALAQISEAERDLLGAAADLRKSESDLKLSDRKLAAAKEILKRQNDLASMGAFNLPTVQQAEKDLNEAEAELESAQREEVIHSAQLERAERLYIRELISRTELEQARLEVEQDKIRQAKARKQIDLARKTFERETEISRKGHLTAREVQAAETEVRTAAIEVERGRISVRAQRETLTGAKIALENAKANYRATAGTGNRASGSSVTLTAPISGVIAARKANVGQALQRSDSILEIDNLNTVWVTASLPERFVSLVRIGAPISLTTSAYKGRTFSGVVQVISTRLDSHTRAMPVQCVVNNTGGLLKQDMFAQVSVATSGTVNALSVAKSAVFSEGDLSFVYVEHEPGKYERKPITTGREQAGRVEVVSGLEAGTRVVVEGVFVLRSQEQKDELKGHED